MPRSLIALWVTLLASIASVIVFAQFWVNGREQSAQNRVRGVLQSQLMPVNQSLAQVIEEYSIQLERALSEADLADPQACFELSRLPLSDTLIVINDRGQLHFPENLSENDKRWPLVTEGQQLLAEQLDPRPVLRPPANTEVRQAGSALLDLEESLRPDSAVPTRSSESLRSRRYQVTNTPAATPPTSPNGEQQSRTSTTGLPLPTKSLPSAPDAVAPAEEPLRPERDGSRWITWYHRRGMVLGYQWQQQPGWYAILALPRGRWMADIVAALPDSQVRIESVDPSKASGKEIGGQTILAGSVKQLIDVEGNVIYQWGDVQEEEWESLVQAEPAAELPVTNPLEGWRLRTYATDDLIQQLAGDNLLLPIWLAVAGLSLALVVVGVAVTTALRRQLRLAASRVSFVNQVSHELRTPLTNICMYADLLSSDLSGPTSEPNAEVAHQLQRVAVIQQETRRLNRLIANVLEFARRDRGVKPLRIQACDLNLLIQEVLATFLPRLEELGFEVKTHLDTPEVREFDRGAVEQILVNLIGNAEKYAAQGKYLAIESWGTLQTVSVRVQDAGPGIPKSSAARVFLPFERLSDRLQDPTGTGIGLTIARELAQRHGGDCHLDATPSGAAFVCVLRAPVVDSAKETGYG